MTTAWLALAALVQAGVGTAPAPLQPTGKWGVEYADAMCVLSRAFGTPAAPLDLAFRPMPIGNVVEIALIQPGAISSSRKANAVVTLGPDTTPYKGQAITRNTPDGKHLTIVPIEIDGPGLPSARTITIAIGRQPPRTFATPDLDRAMAAMDPCQRDLLKHWHVDPDDNARAVTKAVPLPNRKGGAAQFFLSDYYPPGSRRAGEEGTTTVMWTIGVDGRTSDCRLLASSGSDRLDRTTCAVIIQRGRYDPARDAAGKPVPSHDMDRVTWVLG